jgi:hypothetical protein
MDRMKLKDYFKPVFLKWILIASIMGVGLTISGFMGLFTFIASVDITYISFAILAALVAMSIRTGWLTAKACNGSMSAEDLDEANEFNYFMSDAMQALGMIGTVIGFLMLLSGGTFMNVATANLQTVMITALGKMGLALTTTLAGLLGSLLLKFQAYNLTAWIRRSK